MNKTPGKPATKERNINRADKKKSAETKLIQKRKARAEMRKKKAAEKSAALSERKRIAAERKKHRDAIAAERAELERKRAEAKAEIREQNAARRKLLYARIRKKLNNNPVGFERGNYGILPRVELEISGDGTSIAARLSAANIVFENMRSSGGITALKIRKKDLRKAIAILNEMCYNYQISATYGMLRRLAFAASRAGLFLGLAASCAALYIAYGYVWRVDISGNDKLSAAVIGSVLDSVGCKIGSKKQALNVMSTVSALGGMTGVADASCEVIGTTVYVRVLESEDYTDKISYTSAQSKFDAKVTSIIVRHGSPLVKRGDVVKCGDILASGDVIGTSGDVLYTEECDVDVFGEVSLTYSVEVPQTGIEYVRTGKKASKTVYSLFGHEIGKAVSPFGSYEMRAHTAHYDVLIPLYATTYEFYETSPTEVERHPNELAEAFAESKSAELDFIGEFECSYTVTQNFEGLYSIHVFLSGEALISQGM